MNLELLSREGNIANYRIVGKTPGYRSLVLHLARHGGFRVIKKFCDPLTGDMSISGDFRGVPVRIETPISEIIVSCNDKTREGSELLTILRNWNPSLLERFW